MIPTAQLIAFRDECEKLGAHPYVHGAAALGGAGLAAYGTVPYLFHQRERDVRDMHLDTMSPDTMKLRDRRRVLQGVGAVGGGAILGGLSPFAAEAIGRAAKSKYRSLRGEAVVAAKSVARGAGEGVADAFEARGPAMAEAAGRAGRAMGDAVADVAEERVRGNAPEILDFAEEAVRRAKGGIFPRRKKLTTAPSDTPAGVGLFDRLFR